jgi:hypothetical protein
MMMMMMIIIIISKAHDTRMMQSVRCQLLTGFLLFSANLRATWCSVFFGSIL